MSLPGPPPPVLPDPHKGLRIAAVTPKDKPAIEIRAGMSARFMYHKGAPVAVEIETEDSTFMYPWHSIELVTWVKEESE